MDEIKASRAVSDVDLLLGERDAFANVLRLDGLAHAHLASGEG